jgi:hypothetical protein
MRPADTGRSVIDVMNAWLDQRPGPELRLGSRAVPTFFVTALAGLASGTFVFVALVVVRGDDIVTALGLVPLMVAASIGFSMIRKRTSRVEHWVLLEHLLLALGVATLALSLAGEPTLPWLDRLFIAFGVLFAFGRVGCSAAGCCFGAPSTLGMFGAGEHAHGPRRFPVQVLDGLAWLAASGLGALSLASERPGLALATGSLAYAIARVFLEGLRADVRPELFGLSESRWLSLVLAGIATCVLVATGQLSHAGMVLGGAGAIVAVLLWRTRRRWFVAGEALTAEGRGALVELGRSLRSRSPDAVLARTELADFVVVSSWVAEAESWALYVSISARGAPTLGPVVASLGLEAVAEGLGADERAPELLETRPGLFATRFVRRELSFGRPRDGDRPTPDRAHTEASAPAAPIPAGLRPIGVGPGTEAATSLRDGASERAQVRDDYFGASPSRRAP